MARIELAQRGGRAAELNETLDEDRGTSMNVSRMPLTMLNEMRSTKVQKKDKEQNE